MSDKKAPAPQYPHVSVQSRDQPTMDARQGYTAQPQMSTTPGGGENWRGGPQLTISPTLKQGTFSNGFCSCFDDCGTCCLGCWCPCILFGKTHARLRNPALTKENLPCCSGPCCAFAAVLMLCAPLQCIFGFMQRDEIRSRYGIEGNGCTDCLAHTCCDCCVFSRIEC